MYRQNGQKYESNKKISSHSCLEILQISTDLPLQGGSMYHIKTGIEVKRQIRSVVNLTQQDGLEYFEIVKSKPIKTHIQKYLLVNANNALDDLRYSGLKSAEVLAN
jgi:D-arabinose 1-dehydrogenase-like Zn-dependent alcohol dehydrogenase